METPKTKLPVNPDYVGARFKQDVDDIRGREDKKSHITDGEFRELAAYFSANINNMNDDEKNYIQGFMIEYQEEKEKQFEKEEVTKGTKTDVKDIKGRARNKSQIDTPTEAKELVDILNDRTRKLKPADRMYIQSVLIKSGYGYLLCNTEPVQIVNVTVVNPLPEKEESQKTNCDTKADSAEENNVTQGTPTLPNQKIKKPEGNSQKEADRAKSEADRAEKEADRSRAEADRSRAEADRSRKEADRSKSEADNAAKSAEEAKKAQNRPRVTEKGRTDGSGAANEIDQELHDLWTDNDSIKQQCQKVNSQNAYSFVGTLMARNTNKGIFGSFYKRVSSSDVSHVVHSLLQQAKSIGLENSPAYKNLLETYKFIERQYVNKDPNKHIYDYRDIQKLDIDIKHLYKHMSEIYK